MKERMDLDELVEGGFLGSGDEKDYDELCSETVDFARLQKSSQNLTLKDVLKVSSLIPEAGVVPYGRIAVGGMGIVYAGIQHPVNYVAEKKKLETSVFQEEFDSLGYKGFSEKYGVNTLHRLFVCKYLLECWKNHKTARLRFEREGKIMEIVNHRRIPHAVYSTKDVIVSKYFPGTITLEQIVVNKQRNTWELTNMLATTAQIFRDLVEQYGIIHRDIKINNILGHDPRKSNNLGTFAIDLGLATLPKTAKDIPDLPEIGEETIKITQTTTGFEGTAYIMSPEEYMASGAYKKVCNPLTDVYSFGVTAYTALTGKIPFEGPTPMMIGIEVLNWYYGRNEGPAMPHKLNPEIPESLSDVVMKAMAKKPEQRYQSMRELAEALKVEIEKFPEARRISRTVPDKMEGKKLIYDTAQMETKESEKSPEKASGMHPTIMEARPSMQDTVVESREDITTRGVNIPERFKIFYNPYQSLQKMLPYTPQPIKSEPKDKKPEESKKEEKKTDDVGELGKLLLG